MDAYYRYTTARSEKEDNISRVCDTLSTDRIHQIGRSERVAEHIVSVPGELPPLSRLLKSAENTTVEIAKLEGKLGDKRAQLGREMTAAGHLVEQGASTNCELGDLAIKLGLVGERADQFCRILEIALRYSTCNG